MCWKIDVKTSWVSYNFFLTFRFGNSGPWGGVHALMAPLATRIIDDAAYEGKNAREVVSDLKMTLRLRHHFEIKI